MSELLELFIVGILLFPLYTIIGFISFIIPVAIFGVLQHIVTRRK